MKNEAFTDLKRCGEDDFDTIYEIINDASIAYKGVIPDDMWREPYMSKGELRKQIEEGVIFWSYMEQGSILGVMGLQAKEDVTLIRHAYVRTGNRNKGIGTKLLQSLSAKATTPILIGTWADAFWAVKFYEHHGFHLIPQNQKDIVLRRYWSISDRQIETSVVLASADWVYKW